MQLAFVEEWNSWTFIEKFCYYTCVEGFWQWIVMHGTIHLKYANTVGICWRMEFMNIYRKVLLLYMCGRFLDQNSILHPEWCFSIFSASVKNTVPSTVSAYHEIMFINYAYQWELSNDYDPVTFMSSDRRLFTAFPFHCSSTC